MNQKDLQTSKPHFFDKNGNFMANPYTSGNKTIDFSTVLSTKRSNDRNNQGDVFKRNKPLEDQIHKFFQQNKNSLDRNLIRKYNQQRMKALKMRNYLSNRGKKLRLNSLKESVLEIVINSVKKVSIIAIYLLTVFYLFYLSFSPKNKSESYKKEEFIFMKVIITIIQVFLGLYIFYDLLYRRKDRNTSVRKILVNIFLIILTLLLFNKQYIKEYNIWKHYFFLFWIVQILAINNF